MPNKIQNRISWILKVFFEKGGYLICKFEAKYTDICLCIHLIDSRAVGKGYRHHFAYLSFEHFHIIGTRLKSMTKNDDHIALMIILFKFYFFFPKLTYFLHHLLKLVLFILFSLQRIW